MIFVVDIWISTHGQAMPLARDEQGQSTLGCIFGPATIARGIFGPATIARGSCNLATIPRGSPCENYHLSHHCTMLTCDMRSFIFWWGGN